MIAAGVFVVPAAGVESMALELLDALNGRQLRTIERTGRHHHETRTNFVAAVGRDNPARRLLVPSQLAHIGLEQRVLIQIVMLCDTLRMLVDLRREGVFFPRYVAELFDQRQVAVTFDVALSARIAVPVPGPAEIAAGFDDVNILNAGFMKARTREQSTEAATNDDYIDVLLERFALDRFDVWIVEVMRELAGDFDILRVAVGADALVALAQVLLAQGIRIEIQL